MKRVKLSGLKFENDSLLFPIVTGKSIEKLFVNDLIVTARDERNVEYFIYEIDYMDEFNFIAKLIFNKFDD